MYADIDALLNAEASFSNQSPLHTLRCDIADQKNVLAGTELQDEPSKPKKLLLRGELAPFNQTALPDVKLWQWCLVDKTGCIEAVVCKRNLRMQKQEVLCTKWNFVYKRKTKERWLEIDEFVYISAVSEEAAETLPDAIGVTTAVRLSCIRKELNIGALSIYGKVKAVSEIFRYRDKDMFILELAEEDSVLKCLVQKDEYLHWQLLFVPGETYMFSHLRATTAFKGTEEEVTVFVPIPESKITGVCGDVNTLEYDEILSSYCGGDEEKVKHLANHTASMKQQALGKTPVKMCSYKGTITDCRYKHLGVIELDGQIRVFLASACAVNGLNHLRNSMEITVHNVHAKQYVQAPTVRLFSCMRTCVKPSAFREITAGDMRCDESYTMQKYQFASVQCQEWFYDTWKKLELKLCPKIVKEKDIGKIFEKLIQLHADWLLLDRDVVVPRELSCDHRNACFILTEKNSSLPHTATLAELKKLGEEKIADLSSRKAEPQDIDAETITSASVSEEAYWNYATLSSENLNNSVIIGQLKTSRKTGNQLIVDQTGSLDLLCISRDLIKSDDCNGGPSGCPCVRFCTPPSICTRYCSSTVSGTCDFMHIHDIGCLVLISNFNLIVERFQLSDFCSISETNATSSAQELRLYLQCSLADITYLSSRTDHQGIHEKQNACFGHMNTEPLQKMMKLSSHEASQRIKFGCARKEKGTILSDISSCDKVKSSATGSCSQRLLSSTVSVHNLDQEDENLHARTVKADPNSKCNNPLRQSSSVIQDFVILHKDSLTVKTQGLELPPKLSFYALVCYVGGARIQQLESSEMSETVKEETSSTQTKRFERNAPGNLEVWTQTSGVVKLQDVALSFGGDAVKWYPLLHTGGVYSLVRHGTQDVTCFQAKFASQMLQRGVQKSRARHLVHVTDDVIVEQYGEHEAVFSMLDDWQKQFFPDIKSVENILVESSAQHLVTVFGVVEQRLHPQNQQSSLPQLFDRKDLRKIGASVPQDKHIRLVLQDHRNPSYTISLYMNPRHFSYPLGLLPGARVVFYKVEKKSSAGGKVYCQYTSASSSRVLAHAQLKGSFQVSDPGTLNQLCVPVYLSTLLCTQYTTPQMVLVTIQRVLKLALRYYCKNCTQSVRELYEDHVTGCACGAAAFTVSAKASVLVEDGSCNAIAHCDDTAAYSLLAFNPEETEELKTVVRREGEIVLEKDDQDLTATMAFLRLVCNSKAVRRRVVMRAKKYGGHRGTGARPAWQALTLEDLQYRTVGWGERSFETLSLPMLHVDCLCLRNADPTSLATALLCL